MTEVEHNKCNEYIDYEACLFCQKCFTNFEIAAHQLECARLSSKLSDIICSVDEPTPDFNDLYKCDICDGIVSSDRMFDTQILL